MPLILFTHDIHYKDTQDEHISGISIHSTAPPYQIANKSPSIQACIRYSCTASGPNGMLRTGVYCMSMYKDIFHLMLSTTRGRSDSARQAFMKPLSNWDIGHWPQAWATGDYAHTKLSSPSHSGITGKSWLPQWGLSYRYCAWFIRVYNWDCQCGCG